MSQVRKTMKSLGFQGCCLRCDAPDIGGLKRCEMCISNHIGVRNKMVVAPPDDKLFQHVKELYKMVCQPHKFDHDPIHRDELVLQQKLAGGMAEKIEMMDIEDIKNLFEKQKLGKEKGLLEDIRGKALWKNNPPTADIARLIGEETWGLEDGFDLKNYGVRTIPSKEIKGIDRSDRVGEDIALSDVIQAKIEDEKNIDFVLEKKKKKRKKWEDVVEGIGDILDDS